jgi:hypothetical protein
MSASSLNLTYEKTPGRTRRWMRRAIATAIFVGIAAIAILYGPAVFARFKLLAVQRTAMNYSPAADHVVYETDPQQAKQLMRNPGDYLAGGSGVPVIEFATPWRDFYRLAQPPGRKPAAVLFLHERRTPAGKRRLVAIDTLGSDSDGPLVFRSAVFRPGDALASAGLLTTKNSRQPDADDRARQIVRIFAGQCDTHDPAHFTIAYQTRSRREIVDGWLLESDQVVLELRKPISSIQFH